MYIHDSYVVMVSLFFVSLSILKKVSPTVAVQYENIVVRGDESVGTLVFALVTSKIVDQPFTIRVCTRDLNDDTGSYAARG